MTRAVRILVADDEPAIRAVLSDVIAGEPGLETVGLAEDADQAVELALLERPDVALLDVKMPKGGGRRAAREIRRASPRTRLLAVSAHEDHASIADMLAEGVEGYLVKGAPVDEIVEAIWRTSNGRPSFSDGPAQVALHALRDRLDAERARSERKEHAAETIRATIARTAFEMAFQPIYDLTERRLVGFEALSRFQGEPKRGPDAWFAEAARIGLGRELEMAVIRRALTCADRLPVDAYLSVNASPDTASSEELRDVLRSTERRLVVEITEHAPVRDYPALRAALAELRRDGVLLAVDDVGAGFASLRHILQLGPDIVKLDQTLTRGVHKEDAQRALTAALVTFSREIRAKVTAEGIETEDELGALRALGVDCGQGYLLGRPDRASLALLHAVYGEHGHAPLSLGA